MKLLRRDRPPQDLPPEPSGADTTTRRRVEITVEREAYSIVANPAPPAFAAPCPTCARVVRMLTPAAAALHAQVTVRSIYRMVDARRLHFIESPAGDVYLCAESLHALYPNQARNPLPPGDSL